MTAETGRRGEDPEDLSKLPNENGFEPESNLNNPLYNSRTPSYHIARERFTELNHLREDGKKVSFCGAKECDYVTIGNWWGVHKGWLYCSRCNEIKKNPPPEYKELIKVAKKRIRSQHWNYEYLVSRKQNKVYLVKVLRDVPPFVWVVAKDKDGNDVEKKIYRHCLDHSVYLTPRRAIREIRKEVMIHARSIELLSREQQRKQQQIAKLEYFQARRAMNFARGGNVK